MWLPCIIPSRLWKGVGVRHQCLVLLACVLVYGWSCPHLSGLSSLMETQGVVSSSLDTARKPDKARSNVEEKKYMVTELINTLKLQRVRKPEINTRLYSELMMVTLENLRRTPYIFFKL